MPGLSQSTHSLEEDKLHPLEEDKLHPLAEDRLHPTYGAVVHALVAPVTLNRPGLPASQVRTGVRVDAIEARPASPAAAGGGGAGTGFVVRAVKKGAGAGGGDEAAAMECDYVVLAPGLGPRPFSSSLSRVSRPPPLSLALPANQPTIPILA